MLLLTNWPLLLAVLAQQPQEFISGNGAGWTAAAMLAFVLGWLMFKHLPEKDRQISDFIKAKDEQVASVTLGLENRIDSQRKEFTDTLAAMTQAFRAEASAERQACEKHYATLATTMDAAFKTLGEQLRTTSDQQRQHSERNQQWIELLKGEIEKEKQRLAAQKGTAP